METYRMQNDKIAIKYDRFKELVFEKQKKDYGEESAIKNLSTATKILSDSMARKNKGLSNSNILLVGKVQSGKTSNLEMISALAFDNGFNLLIIYGGYDGSLLEQCASRFSATFETDDDSNENPHLYSTDQDLSILDSAFLDTAREENRPIIICSMKRPSALNKVNEILAKLDKSKLNAFIIDDEGDQASLNTNKKQFVDDDGNSAGSSTYQAICNMKKRLGNPIYFAVTATPEANIFQPEISELMPSCVHLISPANLYTGADVFHLNSENCVKTVAEVDNNSIEQGVLIDSLKNAINYYLIASALLLDRNITSTEMIIHVYREKSGHKSLTTMVESYIRDFYDCVKNNNTDDLADCYGELKSVYTTDYFDEEIIKKYPWDEHLESLIKSVIRKNVKTIMQNSDGKIDSKQMKAFRYKIYIGGDLLQRGLTFKHLVCTYFSRWAKKGNMDTNLQRARWFGYRSKYIDLCKVFTTEEIKNEFTNLANIENDLWSQFAMAEDGQISLNDIVIDAEETNLNPTRGNVALYKKTKFGKLWNNQLYACFDVNQILKNNNAFEKLRASCNLVIPISAGRFDDKVSAYEAVIGKKKFLDFAKSTYCIFEKAPFNGIASLMSAFAEYDEVCLEFMYGKELIEYRKRSFNQDQKISALQQGADNIDATKQKYRGDAYVIGRADIPCVQVFNIVPVVNGELRKEFMQYMFSIHFPIKHTTFVKK